MARNDDALLHAQWAKQAEQRGDFLAARMEHLKCVESWKQTGEGPELEAAKAAYGAFVRRDPAFRELSRVLVNIVRGNPGVIQSELTKSAESGEWSTLYRYDRPVMREDLSYVLYFAAEFGMIERTKKGRSYELRVPTLDK